MRQKFWFRASGKTTRMIEAASELRSPVAIVARTQMLADEYARRVGWESRGWSIENVVYAYESGLPVFVDHSCYDGEGIPISPPSDYDAPPWRRLPRWK